LSILSSELQLQQILLLVDDYIRQKHANKKWEAGKDWVQYAGPYFDSKEYVAGVSSLLSEWLVLGQDAIKFENKFPKLLGKNLGILTNSGSSANLLMLMALKSKRCPYKHNSKVITPIAGFPTTLNPILQAGFEPLFVDVVIDTLNLNLDDVERVAKENPKSILLFAHALGTPPDMDRLMQIVKEYNLVLIEDCCDALGATWNCYGGPKDKKIGSFGIMSSCSFYPAHHITMGEGGFVATDDPELEKILRSLREWGRGCYCVGKEANLLKNGTCKCRFSNWTPSMPDEIFDHKYVYEEIGYNLKPIELQASIGLKQIEKLPEILQKRARNFIKLNEFFLKYEKYFYLPKREGRAMPSFFTFALTVRDNKVFTAREFCMYLEDHKIQTRPYFGGNLMLQPAYANTTTDSDIYYKNKFPIATKVTTDTFFLGTSPVITPEQIDYIKEVVNKFMEKYI
jgi:CDP-6-deoxy-D-xylo-4-hexulose-3-dehydrase